MQGRYLFFSLYNTTFNVIYDCARKNFLNIFDFKKKRKNRDYD